MANPEHLAKIKEGVEAWKSWRIANRGINPDLSGADLREANLREIDLNGANLRYTNFTKADLREADLSAFLSGATLTMANLRKARLTYADLKRADLRGADLREAKLTMVDLIEADLSGANLREAKLNRADLREAELSNVDFSGANLNRANLSDATLIQANFGGADLSGTDLSGANLKAADLSRAILKEADLTGVLLVETNLENADISGCRIYGSSVWNVKLNNAIQTDLIITPGDEPAIRVDNLEMAQFIYLLLKYEKLRDVLNTITKRGVLLLGRFGDGGLELLRTIADSLRKFEYLPIIFDFERPENRDYTETVKTLVGLSRFVIVELSGPSVPQELYATIPYFDIPFVPILKKGSKKYSMFRDLLKYQWVLRPIVEYENIENLLDLVPKEVIEPAEDMAKKRQDELDRLFKR
jgi:uncharacterized protein YjbI with pentapeptide repeats